MTPAQVLDTWIERFNRADICALLQLYAEDAVIEQAVFDKPLCGHDQIRQFFELEFARASMTCVPERIYQCDDTAILQWRDPNGLEGCGFFRVENGRIRHQKGYFDQLAFFRAQGLPVPERYHNV